MNNTLDQTYSAFSGAQRLAAGTLEDVALAAHQALAAAPDTTAAVLVFSHANGQAIDLNLQGSADDMRARYRAAAPAPASAPRGRGRPRLGVVAREVTLLPAHWEWLAAQPGGASVTLRKLVHEARRQSTARDRLRQAQERGYRVMVALAGDRAGFEEAARALFAADREAFAARIAAWPEDIRETLLRLTDPDFPPTLEHTP